MEKIHFELRHSILKKRNKSIFFRENILFLMGRKYEKKIQWILLLAVYMVYTHTYT